MKTFDTFEQVEAMGACVKRPIVVHAKQINEEFRVNTLEGNYKQGKPGDYLMKGIDGELYICDGPIFERTYDFVKCAEIAEPFLASDLIKQHFGMKRTYKTTDERAGIKEIPNTRRSL